MFAYFIIIILQAICEYTACIKAENNSEYGSQYCNQDSFKGSSD